MSNLPAPQPDFIAGAAGRLFVLIQAPPGRALGWVLCVPAFAEEMNRSRRMMTLQTREFARRGWGSLVVDVYGTGDSDGDFAAANWETWVRDLAAAWTYCQRLHDGAAAVLSARAGSLLVSDCIGQGVIEPHRWAMWQPVTRGKLALTQLLRLRTVAAALSGTTSVETTADLRHRLTAGETLEIAGYELSPALAAALDASSLDGPDRVGSLDIGWFEISDPVRASVAPASASAVDRWRQAGCTVTVLPVAGQPFWTTTEIAVAPALLDATADWMCGASR